MRFATQEEAKFAEYSERFVALPWAAGAPGTLFDKPEDILFSDMIGMSKQGEQFLRGHDITHTGYFSKLAGDKQSWVWVSGVNLQVQQAGVALHLVYGSDNQELVRCMDILEPLMLPTILRVDAHRRDEKTLVGTYWSVRGCDLENGLPAMFKSGDQWLVVFTRYHRTEIVHTARNRADAIDYCMRHYSERKDTDDSMEDQYDDED